MQFSFLLSFCCYCLIYFPIDGLCFTSIPKRHVYYKTASVGNTFIASSSRSVGRQQEYVVSKTSAAARDDSFLVGGGRLILSMTSSSSLHSHDQSMPYQQPNLLETRQQKYRGSTLQHKLSRAISNFGAMNEVTKWRIAAFTFVSSIFAFSSQLDIVMIHLWNFLQNGTSLLPRMFRHDHWEWGVAVWAFFFWIHGFWLADRAVSKADAKGIVHPWKKYRLQDQYEAEKFRRMQLRKMEQGESVDMDAKPPVVKQHKWHLGFWIFELPLYCIPLYIWDICIPRRAAKIAAWGAPTALGVCKDVTCALLLYDLGFFVCHYLMHKVPLLYKYVHAKHHISTEVRASDIVRLSFVEEIVDVGISILALNYLKCHPISRTLYNVIITFMLTELHSGFAFPWTPQFVVPFGLATGSKGHHYHHRNGEHYYQKFFCHVDRLFGFVQKKDGSLKGYSVA